MKKLILSIIIVLSIAGPSMARDFLVEFVEENYKETQAQFSYSPLIYHSIQINSNAGPKLLILKGDDYTYRNWIRRYIAQNKKFITKIPDDQSDEFVSSKAFELDVSLIHPFNGDLWEPEKIKSPGQNTIGQNIIEGTNNILILDTDKRRTGLVRTIIEKMNFNAAIMFSGQQIINTFKLQPDKFKLIVINHDEMKIPSAKIVQQLLKIDPFIPILINTGYQNVKIKNELFSKFSKNRSVHIKPVILRDLEKTVNTLTKENA